MTAKDWPDAAIRQWATTDPLTTAGDEQAIARIVRHADAITQAEPWPVRGRGSRHLYWAGGAAAMAASVAIALLLAPANRPAGEGPLTAAAPVMLAEADSNDTQLFALLYTPTSEEEFLL